jgi:hypothetical protein
MLLINLDATKNANSLLREMLNSLPYKEPKVNETSLINKISSIFKMQMIEILYLDHLLIMKKITLVNYIKSKKM